jgi:hypothetical protein
VSRSDNVILHTRAQLCAAGVHQWQICCSSHLCGDGLPNILLLLQRRCLPGKLAHFHTIGFGPDSFLWLRKMAAAVPGGQFHDHAPRHGQALSYAALLSTFQTISSGVTAARSTPAGTLGQHTTSNLIVRPPGAWQWRSISGNLMVCKWSTVITLCQCHCFPAKHSRV